MSVSDESEDQGVPLSDGSTGWLPAALPSDELEEIEPDEIVVRVTDDRAIVFATPNETKLSRWGRWLAKPTTSELKPLLQNFDPVARAVIEAKRLTGALVELHPADREMFKSGFKAISEEGGWLQANFRDHGQVARLMRIRPATGVEVMSGGALTLAAIAAQAQAAEMARDIKAIGQRVDQLYKHVKDDQIGAVEHAVAQVEDLVGLLRAHGKDGVSESDVSVVRNALGDASHKCMQHLKTAVKNLEKANQGSTRQAEQILSEGAVEEVMLYLDLVGRLDVATVQFGLAQIAFDCHAGKPHVAKTRAEQITRSIDKFRLEIEKVCGRLGQLDESVRAQFLPWWKRAGKEIAAKAGFGTVAGAGKRRCPSSCARCRRGRKGRRRRRCQQQRRGNEDRCRRRCRRRGWVRGRACLGNQEHRARGSCEEASGGTPGAAHGSRQSKFGDPGRDDANSRMAARLDQGACRTRRLSSWDPSEQ